MLGSTASAVPSSKTILFIINRFIFQNLKLYYYRGVRKPVEASNEEISSKKLSGPENNIILDFEKTIETYTELCF